MNLTKVVFPKRFSLLKNFSQLFLIASTLIRLSLYIWSFSLIDFSFTNFSKILGLGFLFDIGTLSFINTIYGLYWLIIPKRLHGTRFDNIFTNTGYFLILYISSFFLLGEIFFWKEFKIRYNFIAVDYPTYISNIILNIDKYIPLVFVLTLILFLVLIGFKFARKRLAFENCYRNKNRFKNRFIPYILWPSIAMLFFLYNKNNDIEKFKYPYQNELVKAGTYSLFTNYLHNKLYGNDFYIKQNLQKSPKTIEHNSKDTLAPSDIIKTRDTNK